jgi:hypothetical protein
MSKLILFFGSLLLFVNTLFGLIISSYLPLNWVAVDVVFLLNILLLYKMSTSQMNNGFKVSLSFIFSFLGIISTILAFLSPEKFKDNYCLVGYVSILFIEVTLLFLSQKLPKITQKNNN